MTGNWQTIRAPRLATVRRTPLRATFIERPHRFAARCRLRGGREVEAHVPNPGRLTGVLAPGCQVLLDGPYPETRALAYTMVAAKAGGVLGRDEHPLREPGISGASGAWPVSGVRQDQFHDLRNAA